MILYFLWSRIALVYGWTFTSSSRKKDKKYCHRQARQRCVMEFTSKQSIDHEKLLLATVGKNRTFLNNGLALRKCLFFYRSIYKCVCIVEPRRKQTFGLLLFYILLLVILKKMSPRIWNNSIRTQSDTCYINTINRLLKSEWKWRRISLHDSMTTRFPWYRNKTQIKVPFARTIEIKACASNFDDCFDEN